MNKKKIIIIVVAALLVLALVAGALYLCFAPGDFGRARWGMTVDQVKSRQSGDPINEEYSSISYKLTSLEGLDFDSTAFYNFDPETKKLTHVSIGLETMGFNNKKIARLISILEEKYGEPEKSEVAEIRYTYKWETKRTRIIVKQLSSYTLVVYQDVTIPEEAE